MYREEKKLSSPVRQGTVRGYRPVLLPIPDGLSTYRNWSIFDVAFFQMDKQWSGPLQGFAENTVIYSK